MAIARLARVIAAPVVLSLIVTALGGPADAASHATPTDSDRAQLVDALERLVRTGEPRHMTHDEGEELAAALKLALSASADPELRRLATRAAAPIVPIIMRPLSSRKTPGALHLRADRVLTLPWAVEYVADIDARLDGGAWQSILRVKSGASLNRSLDKLLPGAAAQTPGFHTLGLRARIRYGELPAGMPRRETRDLLTVHYGVWGSTRTATDPVRPFFDAAASVTAATLDPQLPDVPFVSWLNHLPADDNDPPVTDWRTEWCGIHESMSDEGIVPGDVCVVSRRSGRRPSSHAEAWIRVGMLRSGDDSNPRWVRKPPALVAAYVVDGPVRLRAPLAAVPAYLSQPADEWPSARLVVNAAGISVASPTIVPGVPTTLRVLAANMGDADATGVMINVVVFSEQELPVTHRTFVRSIRAGGSVEIETPIVFPTRYGFVDVLILPGHDQIGVRTHATENQHAYAVINERAAPPGYLRRLCLDAGKPAASCTR